MFRRKSLWDHWRRPIINAGTAYEVAGPVGYILWNEQFYAALGFYHHAQNGSNSPGNPIPEKAGRLIRRPLA